MTYLTQIIKNFRVKLQNETNSVQFVWYYDRKKGAIQVHLT